MSNDLQKLMAKIQDKEKPAEKVEETPEEIDEDEDDEDEIQTPKIEEKPVVQEVKKQEKVAEDGSEEAISPEDEVQLLQNDGIYRREMLIAMKDNTSALNLISEVLLKIAGGKNA